MERDVEEGEKGGKGGKKYLPFQVGSFQPVKNRSRFIAVSYIFEGFGGILAADVEEDFFAASDSIPMY